MMEQGGQAIIIGGIFLFVLLFCVYIGYTIFYLPVTTTVSAMENLNTENKVPSNNVYTGIDLSFALWPIVIVFCGFLAVVVYIYSGG